MGMHLSAKDLAKDINTSLNRVNWTTLQPPLPPVHGSRLARYLERLRPDQSPPLGIPEVARLGSLLAFLGLAYTQSLRQRHGRLHEWDVTLESLHHQTRLTGPMASRLICLCRYYDPALAAAGAPTFDVLGEKLPLLRGPELILWLAERFGPLKRFADYYQQSLRKLRCFLAAQVKLLNVKVASNLVALGQGDVKAPEASDYEFWVVTTETELEHYDPIVHLKLVVRRKGSNRGASDSGESLMAGSARFQAEKLHVSATGELPGFQNSNFCLSFCCKPKL